MKRINSWILVVSLVLITAGEIKYDTYSRQQYRTRIAASPPMVFVSTLRGTQKKVLLPDGSTVWLNAASTLTYPADMAQSDRSVELSGEAFFDVVAKPSYPFKVRARDMFIKVLGTRFNVRNYPEEINAQAVVTSGAIQVSYHDQSAVLHSGDAANLDPGQLSGKPFAIKSGKDTTAATEWTRGLLRFTDADLRSLLHDLSRAYNVDIELNGQVSDHRFQGSLSLTEPLDEVITRLVMPYSHVSIARPDQQRLIITVQ